MSTDSIYKNEEGKEKILKLYDRALNELKVKYDSQMVSTRFGNTHVLIIGPEAGIPIMIFQGGNTVNPLTLSWFRPLLNEYRVYAPDTIGHPGLSSENRISPLDDSFGKWTIDLLDHFDIRRANLIGPSYGAGIILRTASYAPDRISRAVLLVPSGIATGSMAKMMFKIVFPMFMYRAFPREKRLKKAVKPMMSEEIDKISLDVIGSIFRYVKLETKMPKISTKEELAKFKAPTMVFSSENDIFFPASKVNPRAKEIIPNPVAVETLKGNGHFPSKSAKVFINKKIKEFIMD
ncbi:MAG: alpha/beta hydrolase [Thermoplasmata archaeon]|nr:MAG: alpha/beta hydrolase [Thermoplasmata archaeon]